jgi:hypothetical protein
MFGDHLKTPYMVYRAYRYAHRVRREHKPDKDAPLENWPLKFVLECVSEGGFAVGRFDRSACPHCGKSFKKTDGTDGRRQGLKEHLKSRHDWPEIDAHHYAQVRT